jgi:hypothetical protein
MPNVPKDDVKTTIDPDGLRYKSKTPGSPFAGHGAFAAGTMSCFKCGKHRPRTVLKSKRILNRNEMVCSPSCKEVSDQLMAGVRVGAGASGAGGSGAEDAEAATKLATVAPDAPVKAAP